MLDVVVVDVMLDVVVGGMLDVVTVDGMLDVVVAAGMLDVDVVGEGMLDVADAIAGRTVVDFGEVVVRVDIAGVVDVGDMDVDVVDVADLLASSRNVDVIGVVVNGVLVDDSGNVDAGLVVVTVGEVVVAVVVGVGDEVDVLMGGLGVEVVGVEDGCAVGMLEAVVKIMCVVASSDVAGIVEVEMADVVDVGGAVDVSDEVVDIRRCVETEETRELSAGCFTKVV